MQDEVFDEKTVDAYDEALDAGTQELTGALKGLEHENMQNLLGAFTTGLERDLIGPDDFRV